ncbi:flagellar brake protein [Halopseudomonas pachastrellae]|nr:flagellar brake protein [Halopseudomonas pachastrellae]
MIALTEEDIPVGKPLPWNVVDADGKVLFAQSKVVENRSLLKQLVKLGLFRSGTAEQASNGEGATVSTLEQIQLAPGDAVQLQTMNNNSAERYQVRMIGFHAPVSLLVTAPTVQGKLVFVKEGQQFLVRGFVGKDAWPTRPVYLNPVCRPFPICIWPILRPCSPCAFVVRPAHRWTWSRR